MTENKKPQNWIPLVLVAFIGTLLILGATGHLRGTGSDDDSASAWVVAKQLMNSRLKSPSTARYGGQSVEYLGNDVYQVEGWVDSQNSFGAIMRLRFRISLRSNADRWTVIGEPLMLR